MSHSGARLSRALMAIALSVSIAHAANDVWDGNGATPPSNNWSFAPSWDDNTTPGNSDTATFNIAGTYTVSFSVSNPAAIQALTISSGSVTFASTSSTTRTLSVNSASGSQDVLITGASTFFTLGASPSNDVGLIAGDDLSVQNDAVLTAQFGSNVTAADLSNAGLNGSLVMDGPGATLALTGAGANNFIGRSGNTGFLLLVNGTTGNSIAGNLGIADSGSANSTGFVALTAGSTLSLAGNLTLANQNVAGQSAMLDIYDTNSSLTQTGATSITVGSATNGTADINIGVVSPDGTLSTGTGLFTINATGTVTIGNSGNNNSGILNANGDVLINGGVLRRNRGTFIVAPAETMTIQNGGLFDVRGFYNADAAFTVTGAGSAWTSNSSLSIGALGTGSLMISTGGDVSNTSGSVGVTALSDGAVTVTGTGSTWINSSSLSVGSGGIGTLMIAADGDVSNTAGFVGVSAGSDGTVTVTGAGSTWTNSADLHVGDQGAGSLSVEQGGAVSDSFGAVGLGPGSMGDVTVTGSSSTWTNSSGLTVGHQGTGLLTISAGGAVSSNAGAIGNAFGGDGSMTVTGSGSTWINSDLLVVGNLTGSVGALTIAAGGAVSNTDGLLGVSGGHDGSDPSNGDVTVTGTGSTWTNSGDLYVGISGIGTLTIEAGGAVSSTIGHVGHDSDGTGTVTVSGSGSTWITSSLNVGGSLTASGGSGALNVLGGGLVQAGGNTNVWNNGSIDVETGGTFNANNDVTIDGGVLSRASSGSFNLAAGNTMTIENGGRAAFTGSYITATNAIYNVSGAGSTLEAVTGSISINNAAQVNVSSGGLVSSAANFIIGNGGNGTLAVDGSGSSMVSNGVNNSWGRVGNTATVTLSNNATGTLSGALNLGETATANSTAVVNVLSGADLSVGGNFTLTFTGGATTSSTLNVQGSGSAFTQSDAGTITIGHASTGAAEINIGTTTSGAMFATGTGLTTINTTGVVSIGSGANTGTFNANGNVTITGGLLRRRLGSAFNLAAGKTITIQNAGRATFTGTYTTASNAIYNISDGGSVLETLSGGGLVVNNGAQVNVTNGGSVSSASFLDVGISGGPGTLAVSGAQSSAAGAAPGANSWALNGQTAKVTFSNSASGSFLGGISLAGSATAGTTASVDVLTGGDVTAGNLFLATVGGATTSAALTVDGAGSSVTQTGSSTLIIGHASTGSASLVVRNNASFTTGTGQILLENTGSIELNSGAVLDARGIVNVSGGSFDFLGGTLHVDNFNGELVNQGGTLAPGHSAGITNIVGNYKQFAAATLQIELGGTVAGSQYDMLNINGESLLVGTLDVDLLSFTPTPGNTFQIISATSAMNGTFSNVLLPTLSNANWQLIYNPTSVRLQVALPGDYNFDGTIDAADYVVWRKTLGQTGFGLAADGNANNEVDQLDYNVWRAHFGQPAGSGAAASANAAVPEPATSVLLMLAAAGLCLRRRQSA
jgi:T5SS/PEP-CTERM-associated repeat protein